MWMARLILGAVLLLIGLQIYQTKTALALSGADFNPGRIIDDAIFYNNNSMSANQVQAFLNSKVPACDTQGAGDSGYGMTRAQYAANRGWHGPPYTCLRDYTQNTPQMEAASGLCAAIPARNNASSAQIIADVANACGINPQVLIVLLEKEQSLVTDVWPLQVQFRNATGFACPDTAPCDPNYAGFFYQVYHAARQFKVYQKYPTQYNYVAGRTNRVYWQTNLGGFINPTGNENDPSRSGQAGCGYSNVYIENQATAALYVYTPYRPNQKALDVLRGMGDGCSAHGNRNFWRLFNDWFGSSLVTSAIYTHTTSAVADVGGGQAEVRFSLSRKPVHEVVLVLATSNNNLFGFASSNTVKIQPDDWNQPEKNRVILYAKSSSAFDKPTDVRLTIQQIGSPDTNFSSINPSSVGNPPLLWQPKQSIVYRLFSQSLNRHAFASRANDIAALTSQGFTLEGAAFNACSGGASSLIRYRNNTQYRVATLGSATAASLSSNGYVNDGAIAGVSSALGTIPVYELHHPATNNYIYTTDAAEATAIVSTYGYQNKGVAFKSCDPSLTTPLFRLYSNSLKTHFYTTNLSERTFAQQNGYVYEGIAFYTDSQNTYSDAKPVYRLFNNASGKHFYTGSTGERDTAKNQGHTYEGIAWYVRF